MSALLRPALGPADMNQLHFLISQRWNIQDRPGGMNHQQKYTQNYNEETGTRRQKANPATFQKLYFNIKCRGKFYMTSLTRQKDIFEINTINNYLLLSNHHKVP